MDKDKLTRCKESFCDRILTGITNDCTLFLALSGRSLDELLYILRKSFNKALSESPDNNDVSSN